MEILKKLETIGAILKDRHIVYTSGKHGSAYVNKDAIYPHTALTKELCLEMAKPWVSEKVDVALAPAVGGVILSQWVAYHLSDLLKREVLGVYAEKNPTGEGFVIKRGYDQLIKGKNVLILEDILTTGISVKRVVEAVRECGGNVVGVSAICNRGGVTPKDLGDVPKLLSLVHVALESYDAPACPLCEKNVPIDTSVGKGREYLASKK